MKTATRYPTQDAVGQGRFGREVRSAPDDVSIADARTTMQTDHALGRFDRLRYEVDAAAVADAIVDRLLAGRALAPLRSVDPG
jgi:hypothetical protein